MEVLFGVHAVTEAVRSRARDVDHVALQAGTNPRLMTLRELCKAAGVRVTPASREELQRMTRTEQHGGAAAFLKERKLLALEDLFTRPAGAAHMLLALDGVEDPHNLGALLRSADGAGATGVVLPERRAAGITGTVAKAAAGATEHVRVAQVTNLVRSLEVLKKQNVWIVGLDERGSQEYTEFDFRGDFCLVLGREGAGLHGLARKTCDFLLRIPMAGAVPSLNVSVAGAVVLFEAARQRRGAAAQGQIKWQGEGGSAAAGDEDSGKASKPRKGLGS